MIRPTLRRQPRWPRRLIWQLNRASNQMNPFLLLLAFGLAALYVTCLAARVVDLPISYRNACVIASAQPAVDAPQQQK